MDVDSEPFSLRKFAINYLCLYAVLYPLIAHFLMNSEGTGGVGSVPIQLLQLVTLIACFGVGRWGKSSLRESIDLWSIGAIYFSCIALYLAVFFAEEERFVEVAYAARFVIWFLFASIVEKDAFKYEELRRLTTAFLSGAFLQGILAIWAFTTRRVDSIYNEVYATTGGAYVSGKMIVSFVTLGVFLATYWYAKKENFRWVLIVSIIVGFLVILFSYNRATQLSLLMVLFYSGMWLFRNKKMRAFFLLACFAILIACFLSSSVGNSFLLRWQNIDEDGGSGRVKLVRATIENLMNPESVLSLFLGIGYHQTKLLMYEACGAYIGTHSDLLDFVTVYGVIGGLFYIGIVVKFITLGNRLPSRSLERLFIRASSLFIVITGLCTGIFQGTYTFFMFLSICRYWYVRGTKPALIMNLTGLRSYSNEGARFFSSQGTLFYRDFLPKRGNDNDFNNDGPRDEAFNRRDKDCTIETRISQNKISDTDRFSEKGKYFDSSEQLPYSCEPVKNGLDWIVSSTEADVTSNCSCHLKDVENDVVVFQNLSNMDGERFGGNDTKGSVIPLCISDEVPRGKSQDEKGQLFLECIDEVYKDRGSEME